MIHVTKEITYLDSEDGYLSGDSTASMPGLMLCGHSFDSYSESDEDSCDGMPGLVLREDTDSESDEDSCASMPSLIRREEKPSLIRRKEKQEINKITPIKSVEKTTEGAEMLLAIPAVGKRPKRTLLALVNTGTSAFLIDHDQVYKQVTDKERNKTTWSTQGGDFKTFAKGKLEKLQLPQFTTRCDFSHKFHLFEKKKSDRYDTIIGRNLQQALDLDIMN